MGKGSGTSSRSSVKMWGSGTSLSRFELENAGLRNELEPFWAWKCGAPERAWFVLSVKMRISGTAANPRSCRTLRPREAMNGLKLKKFWKWWSPERQNPPKKCKMVMLRNGFFGNLWKWYAPERKFMAKSSGGLWPSLARHIPNMHAYIIGSTPPPPPRGVLNFYNFAPGYLS